LFFADESFPRMGKGGKYFSTMAGHSMIQREMLWCYQLRDITARIMPKKPYANNEN
jgi:hypothetical protein